MAKYSLSEIWKARKEGLPVLYRIILDFPTLIAGYVFANYTYFSPNFVSALYHLGLVLSGFFFFINKPFVGILLYFVSEILDGVDGLLARLKNKRTLMGKFLEIYFPTYLMLFTGVVFFLYKSSKGNPVVLFLYIFYLISQVFHKTIVLARRSLLTRASVKNLKCSRNRKTFSFFGKKAAISLDGITLLVLPLVLIKDIGYFLFSIYLLLSSIKYLVITFRIVVEQIFPSLKIRRCGTFKIRKNKSE